MKKLFLGVLVWVVGCGVADETRVSPELPDGVTDARLIDRVNWNGEEISFFDASGPEDGAPAIAVSSLWAARLPELEAAFLAQADYPVTPAELWRAATGDDQVPSELLAQHAYQAREDGRPEGLQQFDAASGMDVEKAVTASFYAQMFPVSVSETGTGTGCWTAGMRGASLGLGQGVTFRSVCSNNGTAIRPFGVDGPFCSASLNLNSTVRTGMYNPTGVFIPPLSMTGKHCFGTGSQNSCMAQVTVPANHFYALSFIKNGQSHRVGTQVGYPPNAQITSALLGSGIHNPSGAPTFERPTLCAFPSPDGS